MALGQKLVAGLSIHSCAGRWARLLGSVEKVNEIADVVGQAAGGDTRRHGIRRACNHRGNAAAAIYTRRDGGRRHEIRQREIHRR